MSKLRIVICIFLFIFKVQISHSQSWEINKDKYGSEWKQITTKGKTKSWLWSNGATITVVIEKSRFGDDDFRFTITNDMNSSLYGYYEDEHEKLLIVTTQNGKRFRLEFEKYESLTVSNENFDFLDDLFAKSGIIKFYIKTHHKLASSDSTDDNFWFEINNLGY